jgi:hypothetical protein
LGRQDGRISPYYLYVYVYHCRLLAATAPRLAREHDISQPYRHSDSKLARLALPREHTPDFRV